MSSITAASQNRSYVQSRHVQEVLANDPAGVGYAFGQVRIEDQRLVGPNLDVPVKKKQAAEAPKKAKKKKKKKKKAVVPA